MKTYDFKVLEPAVLDFWKAKQTYQKLVQRNRDGKKFYYLDGPPYTTGKIHIGHAWGKALRDMLLRYKRMNGFNVWDRPGFDMHGLPIEVSVEKELGIRDKHEIVNKFGLQKFIEACEKYALDNLWPMIEDFRRLGVWLNWDDPYMTIKSEYIEGAWWALAEAEKKGLLNIGKKAMTWCPRCATALAKHELEYANRKDESIFVKLKVENKPNEYLIVWTTTPWTIPYNMAVMVHPAFNYVRCQVDNEVWVIAEALAQAVIGTVAKKEFTVIETLKGEALKGTKYAHPFKDEIAFHQTNRESNAYTVVLSEKYVTTDAGSGLVHCAPGCGPEDFEVGKAHNITAFNETDEHGCFPESMGELKGLVAKQDDAKFIELLDARGALLGKSKINHEYAHCWRCKTPVIFRATDQWFLAVEQLRDQMAKNNEKLTWVPDWAGSRQFDSWLKSLQDWCISRQRFWGIPLPIWLCGCGKRKVIGTQKELESLTNKKLDNLHRPWIDAVRIPCPCGKAMQRVPDVLDVWLDSGVAPWATLKYPSHEQPFMDLGFPDVILEGKDQVRGWFNSLTCMAMVSFGRIPFRAVYMHGFINDAQGRKMSKSLKNFITPYEIIDVFGADTLRFYQIGGAQPGLDLNFNHEDAKTKHRNLVVLWNLHNLLQDLAAELKRDPSKLDPIVMRSLFSVEERFLFSKVASTQKLVTRLFDELRLNEVPSHVEDLFLTVSRSYVQMVRDKMAVGEDSEREVVLFALYHAVTESLRLLAPIAPFIAEQMWQNLRKEFKLEEESVHLALWPKANEKDIDESLERQMTQADAVMQAILAAREKAKLSVRWPIKKVAVITQGRDAIRSIEEIADIIKTQTNVKELHAHHELPEVKLSLAPNQGPIGKDFGKGRLKVLSYIEHLAKSNPADALVALAKEGIIVAQWEGEEFKLNKDHLIINREVPKHLIEMPFRGGFVYLDTTRTPELDAEGFAREIMRRTQQLRKDAGLKKSDTISLYVQTDEELAKQLDQWVSKIAEKCGANPAKIGSLDPVRKHEHQAEETIKGKQIRFFLDKVN